MRRTALLALASALAASASASSAAAAETVTTTGPGSNWQPSLSVGPDDRALLAWASASSGTIRVQIAERVGPGGFGEAQTILEAPTLGSPVIGLLGSTGAATVLVARPASGLREEVVALRRNAGAATFAAPESLAESGSAAHVLSAATNARGDTAVLLSADDGHV